MNHKRRKIQNGSLRRVTRVDNSWAWEYRYYDPSTGEPKSVCLSKEDYPTEADVRPYVMAFADRLNSNHPLLTFGQPKFRSLIDQFTRDERLNEIKNRRPGQESQNREELSFTTVSSYLSVLKTIRSKWGDQLIAKVKPALVQKWLRDMQAAPKTKGNIKALMHRLFEKAMLWEMIALQRNPMELVEVKGITKRQKKPIVLSVEQFYMLLDLIPDPYRNMVLVAQCLGLRVEEILALHWEDIDLDCLSILVVRAVVHGRIQFVKTEYSEDELPLDPEFATVLRELKKKTSGTGLLFPSWKTGRAYHASPIQQDYIRPAGWCLVPCPECSAQPGARCADPAGKRVPVHEQRRELAKKSKLGNVGWHTFRHTYRSWLDETGAPVGVQQKLMRHADISTTMNKYGNAQMEAKRKANSKVVKMALRRA